MSQLATALEKRMKAKAIPSLLQLAKRIGVAYGSLYSLMKGKHAPNVRTAGRYGKFLGISAEKVLEMGGGPVKHAKMKRKAKTAKRTTVKRKAKPAVVAAA